MKKKGRKFKDKKSYLYESRRSIHIDKNLSNVMNYQNISNLTNLHVSPNLSIISTRNVVNTKRTSPSYGHSDLDPHIDT